MCRGRCAGRASHLRRAARAVAVVVLAGTLAGCGDGSASARGFCDRLDSLLDDAMDGEVTEAQFRQRVADLAPPGGTYLSDGHSDLLAAIRNGDTDEATNATFYLLDMCLDIESN